MIAPVFMGLLVIMIGMSTDNNGDFLFDKD